MSEPRVTVLARYDQLIDLLASGKYGPVTTTIIWSFLFGRLTKNLIFLADKTTEDSNSIRALRGCNTDMDMETLRLSLMPHVLDDVLEDLGLSVKHVEMTEKEILAWMADEHTDSLVRKKFVYDQIPHNTED